jgi:shikimate dehydrogenase
MTLVCASLVERNIAGVSRSSRLAFSQGADVVEARLDFLPRVDEDSIARVRRAIKGPAIATLRSAAEGGRSRLSGRARRLLLEAIVNAGFEYVDIETSADRRLMDALGSEEGHSRVIASAHLAEPSGPRSVIKVMSKARWPDAIIKVAMPCEHAGQALDLARLGLSTGARTCLIGMGEQGVLTRACAGKMRSEFVYACVRGKQAAPGQLDVPLQKALACGEGVILGLLGHPVSHSVSRPMQEEALRKAGLAGIYMPLDMPPGSVTRETFDLLRHLGFAGINVTIPHKLAALRACDELMDRARATGAVNTVLFSEDAIVGENTDVTGFSALIDSKKGFPREGEALVLGAGGAARAAVLVLLERGLRVTVAARRPARARELAREMHADAAPLRDIDPSSGPYDVVVNSTPAGTAGNPDRSALPPGAVGPGSLFVDMVYNPLVTHAMRMAGRRGAKVVGGLEMLVNQGAESFRLWTGKDPDIRAMRSAARRALT